MLLLQDAYNEIEQALIALDVPTSVVAGAAHDPVGDAEGSHLPALNAAKSNRHTHGSTLGDTHPANGPSKRDHHHRHHHHGSGQQGDVEPLETPLEVLAHYSALSSNDDANRGESMRPTSSRSRRAASTIHELDENAAAQLDDGAALLNRNGGGGGAANEDAEAKVTDEQLFFGSGINPVVREDDPSLDPIALGMLTEADLDRLVALYFDRLRMFFWHLHPQLHTARTLRRSPFLLTALAATAAAFDPLTPAVRARALSDHAAMLHVKCIERSWKSIEVVQALCLMVHWASPGERWSRDKSWGWLGTAIRTATEIQLDKPAPPMRSVSADEYALVDRDRRITWCALYAGDVSMSSQLGRIGAFSGLTPLRGVPMRAVDVDPRDQDFAMWGTVHVRRILARALDRARCGTAWTSDTFNSIWRSELDSWHVTYGKSPHYTQLLAMNAHLILSMVSLRFPPGAGDTPPRDAVQNILRDCRRVAGLAARRAAHWPDDAFRYASNFVCVNMAYSATLLLRLVDLEPMAGDTVDVDEAQQLFEQTSRNLKLAGETQLNRVALATHLHERLESLLADHRAAAAAAAEATSKASKLSRTSGRKRRGGSNAASRANGNADADLAVNAAAAPAIDPALTGSMQFFPGWGATASMGGPASNMPFSTQTLLSTWANMPSAPGSPGDLPVLSAHASPSAHHPEQQQRDAATPASIDALAQSLGIVQDGGMGTGATMPPTFDINMLDSAPLFDPQGGAGAGQLNVSSLDVFFDGSEGGWLWS